MPEIAKATSRARGTAVFCEAPAWQSIGEGWRPLGGSFGRFGYSVEWHDFSTDCGLDWSRSFHSEAVEICLNLSGRGEVCAADEQLEFLPSTVGFYFQNEPRLEGRRAPGERHQFLTIELSVDFLARHIGSGESGLHPVLRNIFGGKTDPAVSRPAKLTTEYRQMVLQLCRPPVPPAARRVWYGAKVLEVASSLLYQPASEEELFCQRQKRLNQERVGKVIGVLQENLAESLSLEEIGRRVGCSRFHLSRIFSQEMGCGVFQYLRALRMERAAELLRAKKLNVTQVAMEVGFASPSHFSTAFHETFGCCPGLYPLRTIPLNTAK